MAQITRTVVLKYPTPEEMSVQYSNMIQVTVAEQDVYLDFFRVHPEPNGTAEDARGLFLSRTILTPEHARRLIGALQDAFQRQDSLPPESESKV